MRTALALLLCASLAHAEPPADAPLEGRAAMVLRAGEIVPFDATCLDDARTIATAKRIAACEAGEKKAAGQSVISAPVLVVAILGALAVGVLAGTAAGYAAAKR